MDMRIAGSGNIPSGTYDKVVLHGSGRLCGEISCASFVASGSIKGESITCTESFKASGVVSFTGKIEAGNIHAAGKLTCGALAAGKEVSVLGTLRISGNAQATQLHVAGSLKCTGTLQAEHIDLQAGKAMNLSSVTGNNVRARRKAVSIFLKRRTTVAERIEGDILDLEYVTCPRVTGRIVTVGKGCKIALMQYSEKINISPKAKVEKTEKI